MMKSFTSWDDFKPYGIRYLIDEACAYGMRILCDLTPEGVELLTRFFGTPMGGTPNWNSGGVASVMLPRELFSPLARFILFEEGSRVVAVPKGGEAVYDVYILDWVDRSGFNIYRNPKNPEAAAGDRNVHQASGRTV